jgi:chromosome segregation ATPase
MMPVPRSGQLELLAVPGTFFRAKRTKSSAPGHIVTGHVENAPGHTSDNDNDNPSIISALSDHVTTLREQLALAQQTATEREEQLQGERDTERMERTIAQAEASALRAERNAAQAEASTREEEVERLILERDAERTRVEEADRRIEAERLRAATAEARESDVRAERDRLLQEWEMAQVARKAAEDELTAWTSGGPLGRAWRALVYRRGRP